MFVHATNNSLYLKLPVLPSTNPASPLVSTSLFSASVSLSVSQILPDTNKHFYEMELRFEPCHLASQPILLTTKISGLPS